MQIQVPKRLIRDGYIRVTPTAWRGANGGDRYTLCIPVDLLDDPSTRILLRDEFDGPGYEARERQLLDTLLSPNSLFLDIGAHWGIYCLHVLSAPLNVRVVAVEPDPTNLRHLRYNLAENGAMGRARVVAAAAAGTTGSLWLRQNTAMGHHVTANPERVDIAALEVETVTIDDLVRRFDAEDGDGGRPICIKIDIEGRERLALEGAVNTLRSGRVAGVLWEARVGGVANPDALEIAAFLQQHGLTTEEINPDYRLSTPSRSL